MYEDSRVVVMVDNPINRKGSRHIDTHKHFIGDLVQGGEIFIPKTRLKSLTKHVPTVFPSKRDKRNIYIFLFT
jgi:hypothetical protein